ncbi:MAG: FAD binding domain-containing protein, partial [Anaerolineales bacterium]
MIREYFRPASVEDALALLIEADQNRKPLGGGTRLSRQQVGEFDVVDLQGCGLDKIKRQGTHVHVGAMVRLVDLINHPDVHPEIKKAINIDANENNRNIATLGGWLVSSSGRSIFSTLLLALDSTLTWEPKTNRVQMGDWLPVREKKSPGL